MEPKAVIFDLDGTLLDTVPDIALCLNETLDFFGFRTLSEEKVRSFVGNGARKLLERSLPEGAFSEEIFAEFKRRYALSANMRTRPYAGAEEYLRRLKAEKWKIAVLSNKPQAAAEKTLKTHFPPLFDEISADGGQFPLKPDPASSRHIAAALHVPLKNCVLVGDGETDVATAQNAKIPCISVLWGYRGEEELAKAGAKMFARSFSELFSLLEKVSQNR